MKFHAPYSSSAGNLYIVTSQSGRKIIIDPGVKWDLILEALDYKLDDVVACLVSHGHITDHCKSAPAVLDQGIDVYANWHTLEAVDIDGHRGTHPIESMDRFEVPPFRILPFEVKHDVPNLGFVITDTETKEHLLFAIDMANVKPKFTCPFSIIAIGCNYDRAIVDRAVESGSFNEGGARRLIQAHMERSMAQKYVTEYCDLSKCQQINLLHMGGHIDKEAAKRDFEEATFMIDIILGGEKEL